MQYPHCSTSLCTGSHEQFANASGYIALLVMSDPIINTAYLEEELFIDTHGTYFKRRVASAATRALIAPMKRQMAIAFGLSLSRFIHCVSDSSLS